jgi:outer membrane protein insertion porin family
VVTGAPWLFIAIAIAGAEPERADPSTPEDSERPALPRAAQKGVSEPQERLEGLTIEGIEVITAPREKKEELIAVSGLALGRPYDIGEVRRAVELLYQSDRFDNVYVSAARVANGVYLELRLPPRPRVRDVNITGNDELSTSEIQDAFELRSGSELDLRSLGRKRERIAAALRKLGHRSPAIGIATERIDLDGNYDVTLRVDEGPKTRLRSILIQGTPRRPLPWIKSQINLKPGDVVNLRQVDAALARLGSDYRRHGYLEAHIKDPEVRETSERVRGLPDGDPLADLILFVDAGPKVHVSFVGHEVVPIRELKDAASILAESGLGVGPSAVAEVKERILARYERRGHWQAEVEPRIRTSDEGDKKEITFFIKEGPSSYVTSIRFVGAKVFTEDALRDQVQDVVESTLAGEVGRPGADPQIVDEIVGDASEERRGRPSPDTSSPNVTEFYVPRAYSAARDAIADLYRGEGYQDVEVKQPVPKVREGTNLVDVTFEIKEGVRWMIGAVSFAGNDATASDKLLELSGLDPGRPGGEALSFYKVDEASRAISSWYRDEGHLYARVSEDLRQVPVRGSLESPETVHTSSAGTPNLRVVCKRAEEANKTTCEIELVFRIAEGPEVRTRSLVVHGVQGTNESLVRGEMALEEGSVLRESDMTATRANLLRIGVFERVSVHPNDEQQEAAVKDVVVEVRERKPEFVEVGAGLSTEEGGRVFATYSHGNVFGTALRFVMNGKINYQPFLFLYPQLSQQQIEDFYSRFSALGRIQYQVSAGLAYPQIFGLPRGLGAGLDLANYHNYSPAFAQNTASAALNVNYKGFRPRILDHQRPLTLIFTTKLEYSLLDCNTALLSLTPESSPLSNVCSTGSRVARGTSFYGIVGPSLRWDFTDDPLNPHAGVLFEGATYYGKAIATDSPDYVQAEGKVSVFLPVTFRAGFATSLRLSRVFRAPGGTGDIPINHRYFGGGGSTIRGYPEQGLFPQDQPIQDLPATASAQQTISPGGLVLFVLKNELRFPIYGVFGGALFYDVGDLYTNWHNVELDLSKLRMGAGFGFRIETPVGPLTLDFARSINQRKGPDGQPLKEETCSYLPLGLCASLSVRSF